MPKSKNRRKSKKRDNRPLIEKIREISPDYDGSNITELEEDPLEAKIRRDNRLDVTSRMLWLWWVASRETGGFYTEGRKGEVEKFTPSIRPDETVEEFVRRSQRHIDLQVAILWVLAEKTAEHPVVSFSDEQFAEYLGRKPKLIAGTLDRVMALGYFARYQGEGEEVLYARVDDPMNATLAGQFRKL